MGRATTDGNLPSARPPYHIYNQFFWPDTSEGVSCPGTHREV